MRSPETWKIPPNHVKNLAENPVKRGVNSSAVGWGIVQSAKLGETGSENWRLAKQYKES